MRTPTPAGSPTRRRGALVQEIPGILSDYATAALNALDAGFDAVQIHASNGYLIDQFLRDSSNFRSDAYGGSIANRIRLLVEVTQAVADAVGADRTGVRLSPNGETQGVRDSDPLPLFIAAGESLSGIGIAHLELREPPLTGTFGVGYLAPLATQIRPAYKGPLILNSDFDAARAQAEIDAGIGDAVSFGRPFISNPDFPRRLAEGLTFMPDDQATWFAQGPEGYVDYPAIAGPPSTGRTLL